MHGLGVWRRRGRRASCVWCIFFREACCQLQGREERDIAFILSGELQQGSAQPKACSSGGRKQAVEAPKEAAHRGKYRKYTVFCGWRLLEGVGMLLLGVI